MLCAIIVLALPSERVTYTVGMYLLFIISIIVLTPSSELFLAGLKQRKSK